MCFLVGIRTWDGMIEMGSLRCIAASVRSLSGGYHVIQRSGTPPQCRMPSCDPMETSARSNDRTKRLDLRLPHVRRDRLTRKRMDDRPHGSKCAKRGAVPL